MKYLLIFLLVLAISVISVMSGIQNGRQVIFNYLLAQGEYRISTLLAVLFAAGSAVGWLICGLFQLRIRASLARVERKVKRLENQLSSTTNVAVVPHLSVSKEQLPMLKLLFLLLPVATAYDWCMGRRGAQQNRQDEANRLSCNYVTGINFLLNNQQGEAVDLFLDMSKEDTGIAEVHPTLGNLPRPRGEINHAIRIHQTLMESASLTYEQRLLMIQ